MEEEKKVIIKNHAFNPADLSVKVGEKVNWVNEDDDTHTVTSLSEEEKFDSGNIDPKGTYAHTFSKAGEFDYYCSIHPNMKGKIIVE